jgi:glycosyltransferase involved in cell wall biosynthesis
MKVLTLFNARRHFGGEDVVVDAVDELLRARGHAVTSWRRTASEIGGGVAGKLSALASSVYSLRSRREMERLLDRVRPDVVHAHNLYPLLSPSVLAACRRRGVPSVLHCHSFLLTCPVTFHYRDGAVCEECLGGREHWCAIHDCRGNRAESVAYALRNAAVRRLRLLHDGVDAFVAPSAFLKRHPPPPGSRRSGSRWCRTRWSCPPRRPIRGRGRT